MRQNQLETSLMLEDYLSTGKSIKKLRRLNKRQSKQRRKKMLADRRRRKRERLENFARNLENNLPKSECWFRTLYDKHYRIQSDQFNRPFANKIPDLINKEFKYIVEIDGSYHDLQYQKYKDSLKDKLFERSHLKVFRLKAYDTQGYINLINELVKIRGHVSKPTKEFNNFIQNALTHPDTSGTGPANPAGDGAVDERQALRYAEGKKVILRKFRPRET